MKKTTKCNSLLEAKKEKNDKCKERKKQIKKEEIK